MENKIYPLNLNTLYFLSNFTPLNDFLTVNHVKFFNILLILNDTGRLLLYLLGFTITSIGSMSGVAAVMGLVPQGTKKLMIMNGVTGTVVIGVGIIWIVLTSTDKLDL
jgi:hypothetical protein